MQPELIEDLNGLDFMYLCALAEKSCSLPLGLQVGNTLTVSLDHTSYTKASASFLITEAGLRRLIDARVAREG